MSDDTAFLDALLAAMRTPSGPPSAAVELETEDGVELLLHGHGPEYEDQGVMVIPAALVDGR
jgi:hypothetical protein